MVSATYVPSLDVLEQQQHDTAFVEFINFSVGTVQNLDSGLWTGPWTGLWTGPWTGLWTE